MKITPQEQVSRLEYICGNTQEAINFVEKDLQEEMTESQREYMNEVLTELKRRL
jgi:hypothetical protein